MDWSEQILSTDQRNTMKSKHKLKLQLVPCSERYWEFIRLLRMNRDVEGGFIERADISVEDKISCMNKYAEDYRVCFDDITPCGYIGVVENDLRICVTPDYWGIGVGSFMLNQTKELWPNPQVRIKVSNVASINLFRKNGYTEKYVITEHNEKSDA